MDKKCRYCATMIPSAAKVCPNCGKTLGLTRPVIVLIWIIAFAVIAFLWKEGLFTVVE